MANAIGYVTSGDYATFGTQFETGVNGSGGGWTVGANVSVKHEEAKGDYDGKNVRQVLSKLVAKLSNDPDVKLIVAVGGLVSAFAAAKHSTKPFLVIVGQIPAVDDFDLDPDVSFNFCGGINLDTPATNAARIADIRPTGAQTQDVFLAFNNNARMGKAEQRAFKAIGGSSIAICGVGDNDVSDFDNGFKKAKKKGAKALVVSADPFFAHNRSDLVKAANAASVSLPVCYPSVFYKQGTGTDNPVAGRDKYRGPDLQAVYTQLGDKAGKLLTKLTSGAMLPEFMGLDTAATSIGNF